jgi:hypothetical protein
MMDSTQNTALQLETYRTTWTIQNFPTLMEFTHQPALDSAPWKIKLLSYDNCSEWRLRCFPSVYAGSRTTRLVLDLLDPGQNNTNATFMATIKLLVKGGREKVLNRGGGNLAVLQQNILIADATHDSLKDPLESLMPGGQLTVCVEFEILAALVNSGVQLRAARPALLRSTVATNVRKEMLDSFVDIGPSSVLLVFADGELTCHSFPLAARQGSLSQL